MVEQLIAAMADQCEADGVAIDGEAGGAVHQWIVANVRHSAEQTFFIVFLLTAELADRESRRDGFTDQFDRAAQLAFAK